MSTWFHWPPALYQKRGAELCPPLPSKPPPEPASERRAAALPGLTSDAARRRSAAGARREGSAYSGPQRASQHSGKAVRIAARSEPASTERQDRMAARIDQVVTAGVNTWIIGDDEEVIVVDPGTDAEAVLAAAGER